jgi:sodium/bile acid cotransporter 7
VILIWSKDFRMILATFKNEIEQNKLDKQNIFLLLLIVMVAAGKLIPFRSEYNQYFNLSAFIDWGIAAFFCMD